MSKITCPYCLYTRSWKIRRGARKCKKCRREFRHKTYPVLGIRSTSQDWKECLHVFVRQRSVKAVVQETGLGHCRVEKMLTYTRQRMNEAMPDSFSGICEADETFIGGQRKNKRLHIRRRPCKRGHGTDKTPIVGVLSRDLGQVSVKVLERRCEQTVIGFIVSQLSNNAVLYTDGYKMNRAVCKYGVEHHYADHDSGEYVRGNIHTNGIEGFWGYLKRNLAMIGGIRRDRMQLFVAELVWRYNHRHLTPNEKQKELLKLILSD